VPAEVRRKLGLVPGSVIEWVDEGGKMIVRAAGQFTSQDIHKAVFPEGSPAKVSVASMKASIGKWVGKRHARGRY
jgi:antitoxin PrlF